MRGDQRKTVLSWGVAAVVFLAGTWMLDKFTGTGSGLERTVLTGLCMAAGLRTGRWVFHLATRRRR